MNAILSCKISKSLTLNSSVCGMKTTPLNQSLGVFSKRSYITHKTIFNSISQLICDWQELNDKNISHHKNFHNDFLSNKLCKTERSELRCDFLSCSHCSGTGSFWGSFRPLIAGEELTVEFVTFKLTAAIFLVQMVWYSFSI